MLTRDVDKPRDDPNIKGDVYKTLFVARLAYGVEKEDLEMIFKQYGPVESIRIVEDLKAKADDPIKKKRRGYAFVVYKSERDMKGKAAMPQLLTIFTPPMVSIVLTRSVPFSRCLQADRWNGNQRSQDSRRCGAWSHRL